MCRAFVTAALLFGLLSSSGCCSWCEHWCPQHYQGCAPPPSGCSCVPVYQSQQAYAPPGSWTQPQPLPPQGPHCGQCVCP
jgi:hypothetical protein